MMKKIIILLAILFAVTSVSYSQKRVKRQFSSETFLEAKPKDGFSSFYAYIKKNLVYPKASRDFGISGKVDVEFEVDAKGKLINVAVIHGLGPGFDQEAINVIQNSTMLWIPEVKEGYVVNKRNKIRVNFYPQYESFELDDAIRNGDLDYIKKVLDAGYSMEINGNTKLTLLSGAAKYGHLEMVKYLLSKGANINGTKNYSSPLMWAATRNHLPIIQYLVENGADIEVKNNFGNTPLMDAIKKDHVPTIKYLIEKGANINAKNKGGKTPLMIATNYKREHILAYLKEKGATM